jgi:erythromycin esterase
MVSIASNSKYLKALRSAVAPVDDPSALRELHDLIGTARIVMLGESTHGTSQFYEWRRMISERLIRDHGFGFIAVEGDWPDCQRVHKHVTGGEGSPREALAGYRRFPTWMWGNEEVLELVEWLRGYNDAARAMRPAAGFHGLDVYSLYDSMRLVVEYLERVDPEAAITARHAYACFEPYGHDPENYAHATRFVPADCESQVIAALRHMERQQDIYSRINPDHVSPGEAYFDAAMNARVSRSAEAYYRTMVSGGAASWNIRDRHMLQTLELLLDHYGPESRAIVWAHNTHIGDYRATDMARAGYVNLGGLARERFGEKSVRLIGFTTHHGTVAAAQGWDEPCEIMSVPRAVGGSLEDLLHQTGTSHAFVPLRGLTSDLRADLNDVIGHRAIGVVYHPEHERRGNYVPTKLAERYDGLFFIDDTQAVTPLAIAVNPAEEPEAYPTGF